MLHLKASFTLTLPVVLGLALSAPLVNAQEAAPAQVAPAGATPADLAEATRTLEDLRARSRPTPWTVDELDRAQGVIDEAAHAEATSVRWTYAKALIALHRGDKNLNRDLMRAVVKQEPDSAEYQARLGTAIFNSISGAGMDALSLADEGKAAYEKAIAIETANVEARIGLATYYIEAPALFGGSYRKAREQAQALVDSKTGDYYGHMLLARIAGKQEKWKDMNEAYAKMRAATGEDASPADATIAHASALLTLKKDAKAALEVIKGLDDQSRQGSLSTSQQISYHAVRGRAFASQSLNNDAYEELGKAIALAPKTARLSRMALAQTCEKLGKLQEALTHYEAYVENFPAADDADDAKSKVTRLRKRLAQ
jgi:hypothetical protein